MSAFSEIQRQILELLHTLAMRGESTDLATICASLPGPSEGLVDKALHGFRTKGLVTFLEVLGDNGLRDIELTASGIEYAEAHATSRTARVASPQTVVVTGGNVQIGNHNSQRTGRK